MGADADEMVECPACHLTVRIAQRCEICGSPLPAPAVAAAAAEPAPPIHMVESVDQAPSPAEAAPEAEVPRISEDPEPVDDPQPVDEPASTRLPVEEQVAAVDENIAPQEIVERPEPPFEIPQPAPEPWQRPPAPPISPEPPRVAEKPSVKEIARRLFTDFDFKGRMAKRAFWRMFAWRAGAGLLGVALILSDEDTQYGEPGALAVLVVVALAVIGFSGLAEASRRLHDIGKPGLWNLLILIPYIGVLPWLYFLTRDGQPHDNPYGPVPADQGVSGGAPPR
jgi:uncharacterized membrane protein YhaH (DUF805 family)